MSGVEMPASGDGTRKGAADGVSASPGGEAEVGGRTPGGESGGGGYDNPHAGKEPSGGGFMGHGGQTAIDYHGGGHAGEGGDAPNAVTGADSSDEQESGASAWTAPTYEPHAVTAGGHTFAVVETSGIAQAEMLGKVGTDASYEAEQESPGSG